METLKKIMANALSVREEELSLVSSPESISSWDSFNSFVIISDIESNFNVKLSSEDIMGIKNVGDIVRVLKQLNVDKKLLAI